MPSKKELSDMQKLLDSFNTPEPQDSNKAGESAAMRLMDAFAVAEDEAARKAKIRKGITGK